MPKQRRYAPITSQTTRGGRSEAGPGAALGAGNARAMKVVAAPAPPPFRMTRPDDPASPLIAHGKVVGAVLVDNALTKAPMAPEDLRFLQLFTNQAGMAIENSMLYQKIEDANLQLSEAQEHLLQKERLAAIGEMAAGIAHELKGPLVSIGGFAARLSKAQLRALRSEPAVALIEPDVEVSLDVRNAAEPGTAENPDRGITLASPQVPAGVRRVGATNSSVARIDGTDLRVDVDVAVIDTGVEGNHPDLNVAGGYNCLGSNRSSWGDGYGHGTVVASLIAGSFCSSYSAGAAGHAGML